MQGRLIYLIGPSGAGKDSLLEAAREALAARQVRIARRVITRSAEAVGEAAHAVTLAEFERLEAEQAFALAWRANGLAYGIPARIDAWLANGEHVLVNGSRGHLPEARRRYPDLLAILLGVEDESAPAPADPRPGDSPPRSRRAWRAMRCSPRRPTTASCWTTRRRWPTASCACWR